MVSRSCGAARSCSPACSSSASPGTATPCSTSSGTSGFLVDANTLYPLLRRLETQGVLTSEWNTEESRPRRFYRTTPAGDRLAAELLIDWRRLDDLIRSLDQGDRS